MAKTRQQKEATVESIKKDLEQARSVVFVDYKGLSMSELSDLRDKLRTDNAKFTVTKNSLLKIALSSTDHQLVAIDDQLFKGPVATLITREDEINPIKILVKVLKDTQKGQVKGGFLGNIYLDQYKIISLANLPSRDELKAKTVSILASPLTGIVGILSGNLRNLVYALNQIKTLKEVKN